MKYSFLFIIIIATIVSCNEHISNNDTKDSITTVTTQINKTVEAVNNDTTSIIKEVYKNDHKDTIQLTLEDYISAWKENFDNDSEPQHYKLIDIDNDGINEVFMTDGNNIAIATCGNNKVEIIIGNPISFEDIQYADNKIICVRQGTGWTYSSGFLISESKLSSVATKEHLSRYNPETDEEEDIYTYMAGPNIDKLSKATQTETNKIFSVEDSMKYVKNINDWNDF